MPTVLRRAAVLLAMLLSLLWAPQAAAVEGTAEPVFINEIHYDNAGTDSGELM